MLDEVIRNLDQHKVKYVLWDKAMEDRIGDLLTPSMPLKRFIIAPYLESHYKPIWTHDGTVLMERNDDRTHLRTVLARGLDQSPTRSSKEQFWRTSLGLCLR